MSNITEWEKRARAFPSWSQASDQQIIDTLVLMVRRIISPDDAAKAISDIDAVGFRWLILCDTIRRLGGSTEISERLVDLLNVLAKISIKEDSNLQLNSEEASKEPKLPQSWHLTFREYGIFIVPYDEGLDNKKEFYKQATKLLNATTFAATLLMRANFENGMHYDAFQALNFALVTGYDPDYLDEEWRVMLAPAVTWILIAGSKLSEICLHGHGNISPAPELWNIWKVKLVALSSSDIDDDCKDLAARAARRMMEIETQEVPQ